MRSVFPKFLLLLVWTFVSFLKAQEADVKFEHLSIEEGLSQSLILDILQDHRGYMWFATRDGLNKFDGYEFNVYRYDPQDSTTIPANYVRSIHEDGEKNLWVGTIGGGLSKFDRKSGGFVRIGAKQSGFTTNSPLINPMHRDASGRIWIGTYGGGLNSFRPHEMRFEYYMHDEADPTSLSHNDVYCMVESPPGILWIGTQSGLNKYDLSLNNGKFEEVYGRKPQER